MKEFFAYYCLAGLVSLCLSHYKIFVKKDEKVLKVIAKIEEFGLKNVLIIMYTLDLLLGFVIIPVSIVNKIAKLITGKAIIDDDDIDI